MQREGRALRGGADEDEEARERDEPDAPADPLREEVVLERVRAPCVRHDELIFDFPELERRPEEREHDLPVGAERGARML